MKRRAQTDIMFYVNFYALAVREKALARIADGLDMYVGTLNKRLEEDPILQQVQALAQKHSVSVDTLSNYILGRLSPGARKAYDEITFWNGKMEKIDLVLKDQTVKVRQEIFVHSLVESCFDLAEACRNSGVSRAILEQWRKDFDFREMISEIDWHKKNFFENKLIDLVRIGHPAAVLFVNRTQNADRGYSEKIQIEHSGMIQHEHLSIEDLDLSIETRREILEAIRKKKATPIDVTPMKQIQDAP